MCYNVNIPYCDKLSAPWIYSNSQLTELSILWLNSVVDSQNYIYHKYKRSVHFIPFDYTVLACILKLGTDLKLANRYGFTFWLFRRIAGRLVRTVGHLVRIACRLVRIGFPIGIFLPLNTSPALYPTFENSTQNVKCVNWQKNTRIWNN